MVEYSLKRRECVSRGDRGDALSSRIARASLGQKSFSLGDVRSYRLDGSDLDARSAAILRESVAERQNYQSKTVILGLEPYLDAAFTTFDKSTTCEVAKYPKHRWRPPTQARSDKKRGTISGFSRKSRFRLMRKLAQCKKGEACIFMTLTTPFDYDAVKMKNCLWAFWRRIERKFPCASMVWKIEPHKSGSWHFHCILYGVPYFPHQVAKSMWQQVTGSENKRGAYHFGVNLKFVQSGDVSAVRNYVLKYMSKENEAEDFGKWSGRVWGSRGTLPRGELITAKMTYKEIIWLWRMISRKRKKNIVKMNSTFFADFPEIWLVNARILAKINEL